MEKFDNKDKVILILYVKDNKKYSKQIEEIIEILKLKENNPNVYIYNEDINEIDLLKNIDFYITERDQNTVNYVDYSYDLGTKVLFGVSEHIFE